MWKLAVRDKREDWSLNVTWYDLNVEEKGFYGWFHHKGCGRWCRESCPVVRHHLARIEQDVPLFWPEAIFGEPVKRRKVFFLGVNPGCSDDIEDDEAVCPNQRADAGLDEQSYVNRHLQWFLEPDRRKHSDCITKAALWLALRFRNVEFDPSCRPSVAYGSAPFELAVRQGALAGLVELNMLHCKSPDAEWGPTDPVWNACGRKTLEMIAYWSPPVVVAFGRHIDEWLQYVSKHSGEYGPWTLEEHGKQDGIQDRTLVSQTAGKSARFLIARHPSRNQYDRNHADRILELLHGIPGLQL